MSLHSHPGISVRGSDLTSCYWQGSGGCDVTCLHHTSGKWDQVGARLCSSEVWCTRPGAMRTPPQEQFARGCRLALWQWCCVTSQHNVLGAAVPTSMGPWGWAELNVPVDSGFSPRFQYEFLILWGPAATHSLADVQSIAAQVTSADSATSQEVVPGYGRGTVPRVRDGDRQLLPARLRRGWAVKLLGHCGHKSSDQRVWFAVSARPGLKTTRER